MEMSGGMIARNIGSSNYAKLNMVTIFTKLSYSFVFYNAGKRLFSYLLPGVGHQNFESHSW